LPARPVGWPAAILRDRGKSGLHGDTVPDNVRRGRPQGQCHRKQTAGPPGQARVKGCGKSAPRDRQRKRHGKPHREPNRIGASAAGNRRRAVSGLRPGWLLEAVGNDRPRGMAVTSRARARPYRTRLTGRLAIFFRLGRGGRQRAANWVAGGAGERAAMPLPARPASSTAPSYRCPRRPSPLAGRGAHHAPPGAPAPGQRFLKVNGV